MLLNRILYVLVSLPLLAGNKLPQAEIPGSGDAQTAIQWMQPAEVMQHIVENNAKKPSKQVHKLVLVDFYTNWCGWCRKLDADTYRDTAVIRLMNTCFYPVKFNAEQEDSVAFFGKTYQYVGMPGRGTNQFAIENAARNGRLGYPTITILDETGKRIAIEPGYKNSADMRLLLMYYGYGHYLKMDYATFRMQQMQQEAIDAN